MIGGMARKGNKPVTLLAALGALIFGPAQAAESTLRMAVSAVPPSKGQPFVSMNAPTIYTWAAIFDCLTFVGHDGNVRPWLALSWRNIDPLTWEFKLRPGVTFSNGEPFNADAVVNAVEYLTSDAAVADVVATMLDSLKGARAIDDLTVQITTRRPNPMLPREFATLRMVAPGAWRKLGPQGFGLQPSGTGPFEAERFGAANVSMKAFRGSWRPPHFDRLELRVVPEGPSRIQGLLSGQLDVIVSAPPELADMLTDAGHRFITVEGSAAYGWSFILNPKHPNFGPANKPLMDVRVRQALNYAVDKEAFIKAFLNGATTVASQAAPPIAFGFDPAIKPYPYDPAKAKALLAEAGYPNGFDLLIEVSPGATPDGIWQSAAADLAAVGVRVELRPFTVPQYVRALHQGDFKGQGFQMDFPAAPSMDAMRAMKLHSCWWKTPYLCVAEDQALIESISQEFDMDKRLSMTRELMRRFHDNAYALYFYDLATFYGVRKGIAGFEAEALFVRYDLLKDEAAK